MDKKSELVGSDKIETARYISGMARELRVLAAQSELTFLSYLLSMAEEEATTHGAPLRNRRNGASKVSRQAKA